MTPQDSTGRVSGELALSTLEELADIASSVEGFMLGLMVQSVYV